MSKTTTTKTKYKAIEIMVMGSGIFRVHFTHTGQVFYFEKAESVPVFVRLALEEWLK